MDKKIYYGLICLFVAIFIVGMNLLLNPNQDYDLELWSYYSGGQNIAIDYFNQNSDYNMKFTGIAADNYTTKVDTALASGMLPDIVMVNSADLGRYLDTGQFADFNQVFEDDEQYQQYREAASEYGLNLGTSNKQQLAIKFENSNSVFAYRADLASKCLGIESPLEMEKATQEYSDYTKLYKQLKESGNQVCSNLSLFATSEYTNYLANPNNIIKDNDINSDLITWIDWIKTNVDSKLIYSRYGQYHELIDDSGETAFLGDVTTVNQLRSIYDFNQPGLWAVAKTPITYQGETAYFLISKEANIEAVKQFFDMTYFDQNWLEKNIDQLGILENKEVMTNTKLMNIDLDNYFVNSELESDLLDIAHTKINGNNDIVTNYDYGIRNTINGVINDYINGTIKTSEIEARIKADLKVFYS